MNKKLLGLALLLTLTVGLGACQQTDTPDGAVTPGEAPVESPSPSPS
jgi:hypothetical protein